MHQISPKNRLSKFAAIGCFFIELDISTNKSSAAYFALKSVGDICCDLLFPDVKKNIYIYIYIHELPENENSEGRLDSAKFSEGCRFRKFGAPEPLRFRKSGQRRAVR